MTSNVLLPKWLYLALVLVCRTPIEGHPRASSAVSRNPLSSQHTGNGSISAQDMSISRLIEEAYKNHELLRPQQWSQRTTDDDDDGGGGEREIGRKSSSDGTTRYRQRKLLQVSSTTVPMQRNSDEKIVFPDGTTLSMSSQTALPCRKSTFCENVANYPRQLVNTAIERDASLRFLEIVDPMPDVEQRIDVTDESTLCRFREQVVYPQAAQNKEKQWLFIVNQDDLKQGIRIEVCLNDGQKCSIIDGFAEGYKTICKQKFIYRELAAVGSNGSIIKDQFRFPSSCCCHVKFIGDPTVRLGLRLDLPINRIQYNRSNAFSTTIIP